MTRGRALAVAGVAAVLLVLGGAGWDRHVGVLLDDPAEAACDAVRAHERARGEGVRASTSAAALDAAARSEVDALREQPSYEAVARWCRENA